MVFFGEYEVSFSAPGRIVLPKKVRELLKGNIFILTKGFDYCLSGFDKSEWEERARELLQVSLIENADLRKRRELFSSTVHVEIDEQGRFVIPKALLEFGEFEKKALIIGVGDHFEIWDIARWKKYKDEN